MIQVNAITFKERQERLRIADFGGRHHPAVHAEPSGTSDHTRIGLVGDDKHHLRPAVGLAKISYDILGIRPVARSEYRDPAPRSTFFHGISHKSTIIYQRKDSENSLILPHSHPLTTGD